MVQTTRPAAANMTGLQRLRADLLDSSSSSQLDYDLSSLLVEVPAVATQTNCLSLDLIT